MNKTLVVIFTVLAVVALGYFLFFNKENKNTIEIKDNVLSANSPTTAPAIRGYWVVRTNPAPVPFRKPQAILTR